ncbi:MAG: adenylate kinase family protein [Thermoprotei archaeon]
MIIVVTGTPGTGKSTVAKALSNRYKLRYVNVSEFAISNKLYTEYDEETRSYVIDEEKLSEELARFIGKEGAVVETIYPSLLTSADRVLVLRRNPKELWEELEKRGWPIKKVAENVEAELLGVVSQEARESFDDVCEINVTGKSVDQVIELFETRKCESIDWMNEPGIEDVLGRIYRALNS